MAYSVYATALVDTKIISIQYFALFINLGITAPFSRPHYVAWIVFGFWVADRSRLSKVSCDVGISIRLRLGI